MPLQTMPDPRIHLDIMDKAASVDRNSMYELPNLVNSTIYITPTSFVEASYRGSNCNSRGSKI